VSPLEQGHPVFRPGQLAPSHRQALAGKTLDRSPTLARKPEGWGLPLSYEENVPVAPPTDAPVIGSEVGSEVGIANFLPTSTGRQYRTFQGKRAARHERDRQKRRRKAKLRACLKKKGVQHLPATRNRALARHVRQEINRAVNEVSRDHPDAQLADEQLHVAGMKFQARRMKASLDASNRAPLPAQLAWGAARRGIPARKVKSAYSSPECPRCPSLSRQNRPHQPTVCCVVCGQSVQADVNAAENLARRLNEQELAACADRQASKASKAVLDRRHQEWLQQHRGRSTTGWP
jgi:transposase